MIIEPNNISYRDTAARIVKKESGYYRYIFHEYKAEYDHLMQSGLYDELTQKDLLIKHKEIQIDTYDHKIYKLLYPTQITFQSYPFEWSYLQWKKAITANLHINQIALKYGMVLKDATPFNFYITEGKAIMFDTSSFMFFKNGDKWVAYKQFCTEFLGPVTLMYYKGQKWSRLTRTHLRGLPLDFISKQLPFKSWFNLNTLLHIHLHARYTSRKVSQASHNKKGFSKEKISSLFEMILSGLNCWLHPYQYNTHWFAYYQNDIESNKYLVQKEEVITNWLKKIATNTLVDLGANTGKFSLIAGKVAKKVIALEADENCVDNIENEIQKLGLKNIDAVVMDLAESTSNIGVLNNEIKSIFPRAQSDVVMALAIVHHLHVSNQMSFKQIAELIAMYTRRHAIIEFVPKSDKKVQFLLLDKTLDFSDFNENNFITALLEWFTIKEVVTLEDSERVLYLLKKND
jgi:hypothetical protein